MEIEQKETRFSGVRSSEGVRRNNEGLMDEKEFLMES